MKHSRSAVPTSVTAEEAKRIGSRDGMSLAGFKGTESLAEFEAEPQGFVCGADPLRSNNFSFGSFLCALAQKEKNSDSDSGR